MVNLIKNLRTITLASFLLLNSTPMAGGNEKLQNALIVTSDPYKRLNVELSAETKYISEWLSKNNYSTKTIDCPSMTELYNITHNLLRGRPIIYFIGESTKQNTYPLADTLLTPRSLDALLDNSHVDEGLVYFGSCKSSGFLNAADSIWAVVSASGEREAFSDKTFSFGRVLVKRLRDPHCDTDGNGEISVSEAFSYAKSDFEELQRLKYYANKDQHPQFGIQGPIEPTIAGNKKHSFKIESFVPIYYDSIFYAGIKDDIEEKRISFAQHYAENQEDRKGVIKVARNYLYDVFDKVLFEMWEETPWIFGKTSRMPKEGEVDCGHFVSECLSATGFKINYQQLAEKTSASIAKAFDQTAQCKYETKADKMREAILTKGKGLYIYGHSCGVGFALCDSKEVYIQNATHYPPQQVVRKRFLETPEVHNSNVIIIGDILSDFNIERWLTGQKIDTDTFPK